MPSSKQTEKATAKASKPAKGAKRSGAAVPPAPIPGHAAGQDTALGARRPPPGPTPIHGHVMSDAERQARRQAKLKTAAAVADLRIAVREQAIHQALTGTDAALELLRRQINVMNELLPASPATAAEATDTPQKAAQKAGKGAGKVTLRQRAQRPATGFDAALQELQAATAAIAASLEPLRRYARAYTAPLPALDDNRKEGNDGDSGSLF